jgi:hypothetical protein
MIMHTRDGRPRLRAERLSLERGGEAWMRYGSESPRKRRGAPGRAAVSRRAVLGGAVALATRAAAKTQPQPRKDDWEVLEVGPGKRFASLTLAGCFMNSDARWYNGYAPVEKIARMKFRIIVSPGPDGYYLNDSGSHSRRWKSMIGWPPYEGNLLGPVIVEGEPGKPMPVLGTDGFGDGVLYYQKGLFNVGNCDATFRRLIFRGFRRQDGQGNYAGIRIGDSFFKSAEPNLVTIEDCEFSGCDNGVMGGRPGQSVAIRRSYFHDNGNQTGRVHNIYIGQVDALVVEDLLSTRCAIGHLLKSRAGRTSVRRSRLLGAGGSESACLDAPNGGVLEIEDVVCEKSPDSDAIWMIHYGGENTDAEGAPFHTPSSIVIRDLTLVAPDALRRHRDWGKVRGLANQSGVGEAISGKGSRLIPPAAQNVQVFGLSARDAGLPCRVLDSRPAISLKTPMAV